MLKKPKTKTSSMKNSLIKGIASIGEAFSTFSIWPPTTPEDYQRNARDYVRKSKAYARKVGIKENDYIFKNPYLDRIGKHNLSGWEKDKETMRKDKESIFGKDECS